MKMKKPPDKLWFPTLLQSANIINSNSWFNILEKTNPNQKNLNENKLDIDYIKTIKLAIYPNQEQHQILQTWFKSVIDIYNKTNTDLKNNYNNNKKIDTYYNLRSKLNADANIHVNSNGIYKHTLDYSIKHCIEMYKSAITNLKKKNIKSFDIKDLDYNRKRYNLVLEPGNFSKKINGFCISELGEMETNMKLKKLVKKNCILQYNKYKNRYFLLIPIDQKLNKIYNKEKKCGIDMGVRTFTTIYSENQTFEIGTNLMKKIDTYHARIDNLKSNLDQNKITKNLFEKVLNKYGNKINNRIDDLHKKISVFIARKFEIINLEKVSIKSMISNLDSNLQTKTKRRLTTLSIYKFYQVMEFQSKKYGSILNYINPYKTSMTCHQCLNENKNLGCNKIYKCKKCKIEIDRDINAAINMYNGGLRN